MKKIPILFVWLLLFTVDIAWGQKALPPNSLSSNHTQKFYAPRKAQATKVKKRKVTRTPEYEFYQRVEKAAKEKQRILRKLSRPQYADPAHFGHKRIPKRRPPHRMRLCKVCHIRH